MLPTYLSTRAVILAPVTMLVAGLPMQASNADRKIEHAAKASYNFKTYLKGDDIKVDSDKGVVTLKGTVAREDHRFLAQETVADLPGVKSVRNELKVVGNQPEEHSDAWITLKVKSVLAFHGNVSASETEVSTQDGVVTLNGKSGSDAQKALTTEYARDIEGVKDVHNNLIISKPHERTLGEKIDDTSITAQVKSTLLFHKSTSMLKTKVHTKNGVVSLHGEAQSSAERDLATKLSEDVHGVRKVHNRMTVK